MGNMGRKAEPPKQPQDNVKNKSKKPSPPPTAEEDDYEDGDMATPKRDRYGNDDEPL